MDTRREFIKKAALLAGAQGFSGLMPLSIVKALAIDPKPGSGWADADHVVILMQENRSFDHCYGALRGVRGFRDPRFVTLPNGNPVWLQNNGKGATYGPFRLDIKGTNATWMGSLPHDWTNQSDARNEGRFDGWIPAKRSSTPEYTDMPLTMGHYTREDIPFYYALADAFTVCDQNFCSSLTGTTPNRLHLWTGTIRQEQHPQSRPRVRNEDTDYGVWAEWVSFPERLEDQGISWKIYQNEISLDIVFNDEENAWLANFGDNTIEFFKAYQVKYAHFYRDALPDKITSLSTEIVRLEEQADALKNDTSAAAKKSLDDINASLLQKKAMLKVLDADREYYTEENYNKLSPREKALHEKAFSTNKNDPYYHALETVTYQDGDSTRQMQVPRGDVLHQFRQDVKNGQLPAVSWLVPPEHFSDHPSSAWYGAWMVSEVMDILTEDPEVWKKTIFILCYDENDGYFDHVPPFVSPAPGRPETGSVSPGIDVALEHMTREQDLQKASGEEARGGPIGLGFRVPLVIASPWSRGGFVNSQVFDHTSIIRFLEQFLKKRFGKEVTETNINNWRRTVCGDLRSVFRPWKGEPMEALPFPEKDAFLEGIHKAKFKASPSNFAPLTETEITQARKDFLTSALMPAQEKGIRPSCSLPYELYADGGLGDTGHFSLSIKAGKDFFGDLSAGSPFTVYAYGRDFMTRNYAVVAGGSLTDTWSLDDFEKNGYHLRVDGPNGFYRAFKGDGNDPAVEILCDYERNKKGQPTGQVMLVLTNKDPRNTYKLRISDATYGGKPQEEILEAAGKRSRMAVIRHTTDSHGWYDIRVEIDGYPGFERRYAGRVETGKDGFSDPAMG